MVGKYYKTAYKLLEKDSFQTAVHTMASYRWHSVPRVQLAVIWSGIESLFNVNTEVSFRISLYIANFLGENEAQAQQIFKQVRKYILHVPLPCMVIRQRTTLKAQ